MAKITKSLRATAYHEAGHAIGAFHLDIPIRELSIVPNDDSLGRILTKRLRRFRPDIDAASPRVRALLQDTMVFGMAGMAAEKRFTGRNNWRGAARDVRDICDSLDYLHNNPFLHRGSVEPLNKACFAYIHAQAEGIMRHPVNWAAVKALVRALLRRRKIPGEEVGEIIRTAFDADFQKRRLRATQPRKADE